MDVGARPFTRKSHFLPVSFSEMSQNGPSDSHFVRRIIETPVFPGGMAGLSGGWQYSAIAPLSSALP
jgi:hypothetical protein